MSSPPAYQPVPQYGAAQPPPPGYQQPPVGYQQAPPPGYQAQPAPLQGATTILVEVKSQQQWF